MTEKTATEIAQKLQPTVREVIELAVREAYDKGRWEGLEEAASLCVDVADHIINTSAQRGVPVDGVVAESIRAVVAATVEAIRKMQEVKTNAA